MPLFSSASSIIAQNQQKREKRFDEVRLRVEKQDRAVHDSILSLDFLKLKDALHSGKFSATSVLEAYAWKALQVQTRLNCVCEFIIESFDEAEALDQRYGQNSTNSNVNRPPLFGIPFSVKNNLSLKGYDSCIGHVSNLNKPKDKNSTTLIYLKQLGAIPFVITNVPQSLLSWMCSNPVYGTTGNPHNPKRTPGGSSGGDAALTAANGTPFGTGSDIGGSLRIPAAFCGCVTLKPTESRLVEIYAHRGAPGLRGLALGIGFFTRTVEEQIELLSLFLGSVEYHHQLVPRSIPLPLNVSKINELVNQPPEKKPLRIGYFTDDGFIPSTPGCARVVDETVEKMRSLGHEMVAFRVPEPHRAVSIILKTVAVTSDYLRNIYSKNPVDPNLVHFSRLLKIPNFIRHIAAYFISPFSPQMATVMRATVSSAEDVRGNNADAGDYIDEFTTYWREELAIDALICPAFPIPAPEHHWPALISVCFFATGLFNLLNFPAGVVPCKGATVSDADNNAVLDEKRWPVGRNLLLKMIRNAAINSQGLPLCVQVVTLPYDEERCLAVMQQIERIWQ